MTATTTDRNTKRRDGAQFVYPLAAATAVLAGVIAVLDSAGNAEEGATATGKTAVGVFESSVDNSAGAAGDLDARVRRGVFAFANSAGADEITLADVGSDCYIVDNQTVAKTDGTTTRSVAGVVEDVNDDGVWVKF